MPLESALPETQVQKILDGLNSPEAKRREATIKAIAQSELTEERILQTVELAATQDPVAYVRRAATATLISSGRASPDLLQNAEQEQKRDAHLRSVGIWANVLSLGACFAVFGMELILTLFAVESGFVPESALHGCFINIAALILPLLIGVLVYRVLKQRSASRMMK